MTEKAKKPPLTDEHIIDTIMAMRENNEKITLRAVTARVGQGSYSRIGPVLRAWIEQNQPTATASYQPPAHVASELNELVLKLWVLAKQQSDIELQSERRHLQEQQDKYKEDLITLEMENSHFQQQYEDAKELANRYDLENRELSLQLIEVKLELSVKDNDLTSTTRLLTEQQIKTESVANQLITANNQIESYKSQLSKLSSDLHAEREINSNLNNQLVVSNSKFDALQHRYGEITEELRSTKLVLQQESHDKSVIENKLSLTQNALENEQRKGIGQEEQLHHLEHTIKGNNVTIDALRIIESQYHQVVEQSKNLTEKLNIRDRELKELNEELVLTKNDIERISSIQRTAEAENIGLKSRVGTLIEQNANLMDRLVDNPGVKKK